ncbi:LuxR C-terminal-related transcriptional regulator [Streptomyces sp. NPDC002838]|uniref:helix-turn-helix transcriptional regulator n=1 Tax=Streptomyces sp. NPDC002838 TaxID=3154436 RepID=UPI00331BA2CB
MLSTLAPPLDPPLRGREHELARVGAVLEAIRRGGSALILVESPPGYGKTRLLRACMDLAERLGYSVAGPADAHHPVPRIAGTRQADALSGRRGVPTAPRTPGEPVLVVLDEFQDLDLGAGPGGGPFTRWGVPQDRVVWLAARRTDTGQDRRGALLSDPRRHYERLVLGPLCPASALELAADVLGVPPGPAVARLVGRAGGHPRILTELLVGMREEGTIRTDGVEAELTGDRLPDRVRARVRATLAQYSRECRQFLSVAAVLGTEVEYTELTAMLGRPLSALLPVMEEACATGVVRHAADRLAFHSGLMRQAVHDAVPDALKPVLHQEVALLRAAGGVRPGPHHPAGARGPGGGDAPWPGAVAERGPGPWGAHRSGDGWLLPAIGCPAGQGSRASTESPDGACGGPAAHPAEGAAPARGPRLSRQQREVVRMVSEGRTNRQMASRLGLSPHTVNYHLRRLFKSYGVNSRIDLLRAVAEHHGPQAGAPAGAGGAAGAPTTDAPLAPTLLAPLTVSIPSTAAATDPGPATSVPATPRFRL